MKYYLVLVHSRTKFKPEKSKFASVRPFGAIIKKIWTPTDFGEIQHQKSFIDILYFFKKLKIP